MSCSLAPSRCLAVQQARNPSTIVRRPRSCAPQCSTCSAAAADPWQQPAASLAQRLAERVQQATNIACDRREEASQALQRIFSSSSSSSSGSSSAPAAGRWGGLLLHAAAVAAAAPGGAGIWADLTSNYVFVVGFCGWFLAQFLKIFTKRYKTGVWDPRAFVDSGGMPSSHSALCSSVTTAIAMSQGLGSPLFAVSICFSVIVMYDAMGVRRHAGLQAEVLNVVAGELLEGGHPLGERKLKEVLGHTPRQVYAGAVLGVLVGLLFPAPL